MTETETKNGKSISYTKNMFEIICSCYINVLDYAHQIDFIFTIQDILRTDKHIVHVGMDYTGA